MVTPQAAEEQASGRVWTSLPGYLTIAAAAARLEVSKSTIHDYIEKGQLPAWKVGSSIAIAEEAVQHFLRRPVGRRRLLVPPWHAPACRNEMEILTIRARVVPGQRERLDALLREMHQGNLHQIPGTAARYIACNQHDANAIEIVLVWRSLGAPPAEVYEAAVDALLEALAEVVESGSVQRTQARVLIHA